MGPGPKMFPAAPQAVQPLADGGSVRLYDTDYDGLIDAQEHIAPHGRVVLLRYDANRDGRMDEWIDRAEVLAGPDVRHLVILLDSIPFQMVRDLWDQGRFRLFHPPSRVISPFPVMTDVCFSEFFGISPVPGIESEYYDGRVLVNGYGTYVRGENSRWLTRVDYHLPLVAHAFSYLEPDAWFDHELGRIQEQFLARAGGDFVGYVVSTSGLGMRLGRNGHLAGLVRLDRMCQAIMQETGGKVQITLLSDHGHNLRQSQRVPLPEELQRCGYRLTTSLHFPDDVVVPQFGAVNCAAIYTHAPASVARDVVAVEGVDLTAYCEDGEVIVLSRAGRARIMRRDDRYHYTAEREDPLELLPVWDTLRDAGKVDEDGFVADRDLFAATVDHTYPDVTHRLWRAFHGLVQHTPDVLVSIEDGWHCGSPALSRMLNMAAIHGNLNAPSSTAFAMTTAGPLPTVLRMQDLAEALGELGVPLPRRAHSETLNLAEASGPPHD